MKQILPIFFAALTEAQNSQLISILAEVVKCVVGAVSILLPALLLWFQKRNKETLTEKINVIGRKVDENTEISQTAFTAANGHNAKIVELREEVKTAVEKIASDKPEHV